MVFCRKQEGKYLYAEGIFRINREKSGKVVEDVEIKKFVGKEMCLVMKRKFYNRAYFFAFYKYYIQ